MYSNARQSRRRERLNDRYTGSGPVLDPDLVYLQQLQDLQNQASQPAMGFVKLLNELNAPQMQQQQLDLQKSKMDLEHEEFLKQFGLQEQGIGLQESNAEREERQWLMEFERRGKQDDRTYDVSQQQMAQEQKRGLLSALVSMVNSIPQYRSVNSQPTDQQLDPAVLQAGIAQLMPEIPGLAKLFSGKPVSTEEDPTTETGYKAALRKKQFGQ